MLQDNENYRRRLGRGISSLLGGAPPAAEEVVPQATLELRYISVEEIERNPFQPRKDFDAEIYNRILGAHAPEVLFVSGGSSQQVAATGLSVRDVLCRILPTARILALADRDDKSASEVAEWESSGDLVLPERNLESFLFADDVINALVTREGKQTLLPDALQIRADAITSSMARGNPPDDLKSAAGETYTKLKQLLSLQQPGNNTDAFMRDTLAPLIVPGMLSYAKLKTAIIDRIK